MRRIHFLVGLLALVCFAPAESSTAEAEIEYLITAIGSSGCVFVRNGKRHAAEEAEDHIRMKYRRARRHAATAEQFIEKLASKSSMSRKPYLMDCPDSEPVPSGDWLRQRLLVYRAEQEDAQP